MPLSEAVGYYLANGYRPCPNQARDQDTIITLLNLIPESLGGKQGRLRIKIVPGKDSDSLSNAIHDFTRMWFPDETQPFAVEPDTPKFKRMEEMAARWVDSPWAKTMENPTLADRSKIVPLRGNFSTTFLCFVTWSGGINPQVKDGGAGAMPFGQLTFPTAFQGEPDDGGDFDSGSWPVTGTWSWQPHPGVPDTVPTRVHTVRGRLQAATHNLSIPDFWLKPQTGTYLALPDGDTRLVFALYGSAVVKMSSDTYGPVLKNSWPIAGVLKDVPNGESMRGQFGTYSDLQGTYWESGKGNIQLARVLSGSLDFANVDDDEVQGLSWQLNAFKKSSA